MSFRRLLIGGFVSSLALTVMMCVVAIVALRVTTDDAEGVAHSVTDDLQRIGDLRYRAQRLVAETRGYLLTGDEADYGRFQGAKQAFEAALDDLPEHPASSASALAVQAVKRSARAYNLAATEAAKERAAGISVRQIRGFFDEGVDPARVAFERAVDAYVARERESLEFSLGNARTFAERADTVLLVSSFLLVALGVSLGVLVVRRLSRQYDDLRRAREAAHQAATARQEILAIVSHDLRNPLNAVALGSELLEKLPRDDQRVDREILRIRTATKHMEQMIDELLDNARIESGTLELRREHFVLAGLASSVIELFQARAAERGITLTCRPCEASVFADRARIARVLSNLVGNALKFTRKGGSIEIGSEVVAAGQVRVEVKDTGMGIDPAHLSHLFDRYWRGTEGHGLGLGLYICKQLVEAHGGRIGVESEPGVGTTVWFVLPSPDAVPA